MRILVICNITIREQEIGMRVSGLRERLNEMGVAGDIYAINSVEYPNEAYSIFGMVQNGKCIIAKEVKSEE